MRSPPSTTDVIAEAGIPALLLAGLILAPLLETLIGQWIPIWFVSLFTKKAAAIVIVSALLFSLQHVHVGVPGFLTALPPGIFLSWCFLVKREQSRWGAYWMTAAVHCAHNACAIILYLAIA